MNLPKKYRKVLRPVIVIPKIDNRPGYMAGALFGLRQARPYWVCPHRHLEVLEAETCANQWLLKILSR